jgi:hypothetical protein
MKSQQLVKIAAGAVLSLGVVALTGMFSSSPRAQEQDHRDNDEEALVHIGYEIAPVPLNLEGRDRNLVGLGSFLVNAAGDCNGCHTAGGPPNYNYAAGGNPYFHQRAKTDPTTYLAGGTDFGPAVFPVPGVYPPAEYGTYVGPDIISRNLTPDKTGRPEGGHTRAEFKQIIRTGKDFDHLHPTCTSALPTPTPANCIPPPVDGDLLQVMPWPVFHNLTDHQLDAIYEYLSAIPCLVGSPANDCETAAQLTHPDAHPDSRRRAKGR